MLSFARFYWLHFACTLPQACRQAKNLFVLLPESYLPLVLVLPPSSLKPFKQFMLQLSAANVPIQEVMVRFGLEKSSNRSNIAFSLATFAVKERLTTDEAATISAYASALKEQGTFDLQSFLASDFNGNGNGKELNRSFSQFKEPRKGLLFYHYSFSLF